MCKDPQVLLHRNECLHGVRFWLHHAAAFFMIDSHRVLIGRVTGITFDPAVATIDNNATSKVWPRFHLNFRGMWQALGGMGGDYREQMKNFTFFCLEKLPIYKQNKYIHGIGKCKADLWTTSDQSLL